MGRTGNKGKTDLGRKMRSAIFYVSGKIKNITGATETLFITQPSLSQVLKEAEGSGI